MNKLKFVVRTLVLNPSEEWVEGEEGEEGERSHCVAEEHDGCSKWRGKEGVENNS
jgi:hypothetical protein